MARKPQIINEKAGKLAAEKLESSGITLQDALALGMEPVASAATLNPMFDPVAGLKIPYFHPITREPLSCRPKWPPFYRVRYLEQMPGIAAQTAAKQRRYAQEVDTGVAAYFSKTTDWAAIFADHNRPIIITEGELKAAKASLDGFPTIGLGGVYNFHSTRLSIPFLAELEEVPWARRFVYIVYDSDYRRNQNILIAIKQLAEELEARGALPFYAALPDVYENADDQKTGLDDFLVMRPPEELAAILAAATPLTLSRSLWTMNEQLVYAKNPGMIIDLGTKQKILPSAFIQHTHAAESCHELGFKADGSLMMKRVSGAAAWLKWPFRNEVEKMTYAPGDVQVCDVDGRRCYNTWSGWGCAPKKGSITPFKKLVDHLLDGAEPSFKQWFLQWCAYPIQHPGTKLYTSVVIHGVKQGTGKSLVGITLGRIYGTNFTEIRQDDLEGNFNTWAENKQFVLGDEITGSNKRQEADMLKKMITQTIIRINNKNLPIYEVPDCINYLFTSNHPDAFFLEDADRRFAIHEVSVPPLPLAFYEEYDAWLKGLGPAALFDYLLSVDLTGFNPTAPAPATLAKDRMIADGRSDLGAWVAQLIDDPDGVLRVGEMKIPGDLFTNHELLGVYDPTEKGRVTAQGLGNALKKAGIRQVYGGQLVRVRGRLDRYYAVRNGERWMKAPLENIQKHIISTKKQ